MDNKIIIIGGGVSGITTALTLQLLGFDTTIYAEHLVDEFDPDDPRFASLYPAASVIPHSVETENLHTLFPASLDIFDAWLQQQIKGVTVHRHFELFEWPTELPDYTKYLQNFSTINNSKKSNTPRRTNAPPLHGWVFDCFIAEWPLYMNQLYALYKKSDGTINRQKVQKENIANLPADVIINCSGIWSAELFEDPSPPELIRGHLVHVPDKQPLTDFQDRLCSYNYTPLPSIYATPDNKPSDVYFYPVNGKWILGGSRQAGALNDDGQWEGKTHDDTISIDGQEVPKPILHLNDDILKNTYDRSIGRDQSAMKAHVGYRYSRRDTASSLRLEATEEHGKKIIHNYGHGGAGVTLSWGCALKACSLIDHKNHSQTSMNQSKFDDSFLNSLQHKLQKVYLAYN